MQVTPCECPKPGWCERHRCEKSEFLWQMCRRRIDYFNQWEAGCGPGQGDSRAQPERKEWTPCRHRGANPIDEVECDLCGGMKRKLPVYCCTIHGECTERRYSTRSKRAREMAVCLTCEDYEAANGEA